MFNKSQLLIIGIISSAMLGIPDIQEVFTKEIIKIISLNPSLIMITLISLLKIALVVASVAGMFQLVKNIEFTYYNHSERTFKIYLVKLFFTALGTIIIMKVIMR